MQGQSSNPTQLLELPTLNFPLSSRHYPPKNGSCPGVRCLPNKSETAYRLVKRTWLNSTAMLTGFNILTKRKICIRFQEVSGSRPNAKLR